MAFYGYKGDVDNCYWTPYNSSYFDSAPLQYQTPFPDYNYSSSSFSTYQQQQELNYSLQTYTNPQTHFFNNNYNQTEYYQSLENCYTVNPLNVFQSEPISYTFSSPTEFKISYSVAQAQFNETDFDEYDTTPYGGGYDPAATYGKPLPPSDKICYPRTVPKTETNSLNNSAVLKEKLDENQPVPVASNEVIKPTVEEKQQVAKTGNVGKVNGTESLALIPIEEIDKSKSIEHEKEVEKNEMYGYGSDHGNIAYGSGLEAMDICETIFGYWPCLAKMEKREKDRLREINEQERRDDSWNAAADYLFGTPNVYTYESYYR